VSPQHSNLSSSAGAKRRTPSSSRKAGASHLRGNGLSQSMSLSGEEMLAASESAAAGTVRIPSRNAGSTLLGSDLNDHFRSASLGVQNPSRTTKPISRLGPVVAQPASVSFQNHMRKSSGLQQALPLLLRQGYAVPFAAYKDLVQEQTRVRALSEVLEDPNNQHRWRHLYDEDPSPAELLKTIKQLQRRLIKKTEEIAEKGLLESGEELIDNVQNGFSNVVNNKEGSIYGILNSFLEGYNGQNR